MLMDSDWLEVIEEHLPYEIDMLFGTFTRIENDIDDIVVRNALINSLAVQCRNLIEFLAERSSAAVTHDYNPFSKRRIDNSIIKKINDQITHLGLGRTADPDEKLSQRDFVQVLAVVCAELIDFRDHLRREYLYKTSWKIVRLPTGYKLVRGVPLPQMLSSSLV